ncbi:MAG: 2-oxoglutarate dehydrogenase E1 component [Magnetospiraceae bacterium]
MNPDLDSVLSGGNAQYVAEIYARFLDDPNTVESSWASFFADLQEEGRSVLNELNGASWARDTGRVIGGNGSQSSAGYVTEGRQVSRGGVQPMIAEVMGTENVRAAIVDSLRALMMIRVHRVRGHIIANYDPLGLGGRDYHPELDPMTYGFSEGDMDRPIFLDYVLGLETATPRQILKILRSTYCGHIGVEFMHIQEPEEKAWIQRRIESIRNRTEFTLKGKRAILERLTEAEGFEHFLQVKYTGTKRFGLEGGEALIPAMEQILKRGGQLGLREVVLGMPHRGRLCMLANVMQKPFVAIFNEFQGGSAKPEDVQGSGDVKYHLGTSADRVFDGTQIHLSLTANPSHLEAVNPVVLGKVRAKQAQRGDRDRGEVMGILLHGDAAFAGQGLVAETLGLSELKGYRTGGTLHFIVNNQIGFTTSPSYSRSSPYPSDVAKMIQAPIFHVNGDNPEAVVHVARIATEFRQEFKRDVVIDMVCYRRHGHNEGDEPSFTQPLMYKAIGNHTTTRQMYANRLEAEGVIAPGDADKIFAAFQAELDDAFQAATLYKPNKADWFEGKWKGLVHLKEEEELLDANTDVDDDMLKEVGHAISRVPEDVNIHRKITRQLKAKRKMIDDGVGIDWATGEALAFGTLLVEGTEVRLSGQDSGRGTFSQRHSVLVDQDSEDRYIPLNTIRPQQATFEVIDSPLSEASVLGFEYGYTLAEPNALVMWEAQFGDFANGAQMIQDQFISSGESKWLRLSGVTMLLPHGYEGQGPEHSSARVERYLQLCAEDNMQVMKCTTPANYFHALRRQVHRNYRKPLVIFTPKSLLRHKRCVSTLAEFGPGSNFQRVIPHSGQLVANDKVRRVVLSSGKVYYDLLAAIEENGIDDVALVRVEQLYPWPKNSVMEAVAQYPNAELVWCQEEPANMGEWTFVYIRLQYVLEELGRDQRFPGYSGRAASASPATGQMKIHVAEQNKLVNDALTTPLDQLPRPFTRGTKLGAS